MFDQAVNANFLKTSPIANVALASKELFHSNFLAWVFRTYPRTLNALLQPAGLDQVHGNERIRVSREEKNLDLIVRVGEERVLVIENKLKSIPDPNQLRQYEEKAAKFQKGKKPAELILLTLTEQDWVIVSETNSDWQRLSYFSLGDQLPKWLPERANPYHSSLVADYAEFAKELSRIADAEASDIWDYAHTSEGKDHVAQKGDAQSRSWLKQHKMHDLFGKRQGQVVSAQVYESLRDQMGSRIQWQVPPKKLEPSQVTIYSGFSNSHPLVGVFCAMDGLLCPDRKTPVGVGFQIQGNQFRSYIEWPRPGNLAQKPNGRSLPSKTAAIAWDLFCDSDCPEHFWPPRRNSGPGEKDVTTERMKSRYKPQCRFGAEFQYRYTPLQDECSTQLSDLADCIIARASSLIDELPTIERLLESHQAKYVL